MYDNKILDINRNAHANTRRDYKSVKQRPGAKSKRYNILQKNKTSYTNNKGPNVDPLTEEYKPTKSVRIPMVIYLTCKDKNNIPDEWKSCIPSIHEHMPDWKVVLRDDSDNEELVRTMRPDCLQKYLDFPYPIQRADFVRALYMKAGGVYMDMDNEVISNFNNLFIEDVGLYFVHSSNVGGYVTNSFMASKANHPFWDIYIDEMMKPPPFWAIGKHFTVMNTTGPVALTRALKSAGYIYGTLPNKLVMPCSTCEEQCFVDESYIKPLKGQSWNGWDSAFFNFWLCNWRYVVVIVVILLLVLILSLAIYKGFIVPYGITW